MADLKGSKTEDNLKAAFAGESQANRRYLYFAQKADVEGYNDVAAVFRSTAEGETGHAHGHLEFLEVSGDPATGLPIGPTGSNLKAAIAGETHEYTDMYPGMARTAREEGFAEVADWFETLARLRRAMPAASRRRSTRWPEPFSLAKGTRLGSPFSSYRLNETASTCAKAAWKPPPHALDLAEPLVLGRKGACSGDGADFSHLPWLPALLQPVRFLPAAVRPDRQCPTGEGRRREEGGLRPGRRGLHALRHVLHDQVSLCAADEWAVDFPHLMLRHRAVQARKNGIGLVDSQLADTDRAGRLGTFAAGLANWATDETNTLTRPAIERFAGIHHGARLPRYDGETFESAPRASRR